MANIKVNLARLLKVKNRIASEITRKNEKIVQYNVFTVIDNTNNPSTNPVTVVNPPVYVEELVNEVDQLTSDLIFVKSLISRANNKIVDKIYRMSECKGQLAFYKKLNCAEGKVTNSYTLRDTNSSEYRVAQIKEEDRNNRVEALITEINGLQDELDEFNATHRVEIDERFLV